MGKFDDFKKTPDIHIEDIYGINPLAAQAENYRKQQASQQRLDSRVGQQKVEQKEYVPVVEIDKTMDLMFIDGILHQRVVETYATLEVRSGESKVDKIEQKWLPIDSKTTK